MVKVQVGKYDWKKTALKGAWALAEIFVAGLLVFMTDNQAFLLLVPIVEAARNWLKHRNA